MLKIIKIFKKIKLNKIESKVNQNWIKKEASRTINHQKKKTSEFKQNKTKQTGKTQTNYI